MAAWRGLQRPELCLGGYQLINSSSNFHPVCAQKRRPRNLYTMNQASREISTACQCRARFLVSLGRLLLWLLRMSFVRGCRLLPGFRPIQTYLNCIVSYIAPEHTNRQYKQGWLDLLHWEISLDMFHDGSATLQCSKRKRRRHRLRGRGRPRGSLMLHSAPYLECRVVGFTARLRYEKLDVRIRHTDHPTLVSKALGLLHGLVTYFRACEKGNAESDDMSRCTFA